MLCISASFWVLAAPKSWLKHLFQFWNYWKRLKNGWKMFQPAFGCCKHPKAGWNTQQIPDWSGNQIPTISNFLFLVPSLAWLKQTTHCCDVVDVVVSSPSFSIDSESDNLAEVFASDDLAFAFGNLAAAGSRALASLWIRFLSWIIWK